MMKTDVLLAVTSGLALLVAVSVAQASDVTILVSRASGANGLAADDNSFLPSISANGRLVAFQSNANNLSMDDNDLVDENIFVRDLGNGTTRLVSRATNGVGGDDSSSVASISADGRFVAFESRANNLSDNDNDSFENIFVRDLGNGTTRLVSRATNGVGGDDNSFQPSISADGRFVALQSDANNLSMDDNDGVSNIFVRDLRNGTTRLVSSSDQWGGRRR